MVLDRGTRAIPPRSFLGIAASSSATLFCARKPGCFTLKSDEPSIAAILGRPEAQWVDRGLERKVQGHAMAHVVPKHLAEVR